MRGWEEIVIEVMFSPVIADTYEIKVPVYLNKNYTASSIDLVLKGKSSNPKIQFDRKQVILPIVPLNFTTTQTFLIMNKGYENVKLKWNLCNELDNLPIKVDFLDNLTMGVTQK